jgi:hypothetical protein
MRSRWKPDSPWVDDSKRLHSALDLGMEFFMSQSVFDTDRSSGYEVGSAGHLAWARCRQARKQLLAATRAEAQRPGTGIQTDEQLAESAAARAGR